MTSAVDSEIRPGRWRNDITHHGAARAAWAPSLLAEFAGRGPEAGA